MKAKRRRPSSSHAETDIGASAVSTVATSTLAAKCNVLSSTATVSSSSQTDDDVLSASLFPESRLQKFWWTLRKKKAELELGSQIGKGYSSLIFKAKWNGQDVAVKVFRDRENNETFAASERRAIDVSHPCLATPIKEARVNGSLAFVIPYCKGGDLSRLLHRIPNLSLTIRLKILLHVAAGLEAVHAGGVVHHDIKLKNVLLQSKVTMDSDVKDIHAMICDFGFVCDMNSVISARGTRQYIPPEAWNLHVVTDKIDVFGFGIMMCRVLTRTGKSAANLSVYKQQLRHCDLPKSLICLAEECLECEPQRRPSMKCVRSRLQETMLRIL